jgi:gamma-glutamyltranspeptidase/glutathione hydrolase
MRTTRILLATLLSLAPGIAGPAAAHAQEFGLPPDAAPHPAAHRPPVPGAHGVVTAGHPLAATAGLRILLQGGNAADASVAVLSVLHVVRPQMSGIGGNGFMTIYDRRSDDVYSLGATGAAPMAIDPASLTPEQLNKGIKAGAVPGLFGGWIALLDRFGTKSLAEVLAPAIDYAENGHPIEESVSQAIRASEELFRQHPSSARVFLPNGRVPEPGELFKMPDLANTLKKLVEAEQNALRQGRSRSEALRAAYDRFYKGDIAQEMARFYRENGGDFTMEDFAAYEPVWAEPVHTTFRGYDVYSSPPTSRGGLEVVMQLNLVEGFDLKAAGHNSARSLHLITEAIKVAKSDIYRYVADPKLVNVPVEEMTSKEHAARRRALIDPDRAVAYPAPSELRITQARALPTGAKAFPEPSWAGSTTDWSVADEFGNVIAGTPTHGGMFGTGVVVGNTGILFNNGTRIGSTSPYPEDVNYVRGGQIPILNNSPTLAFRDGRFVLAIASPGGETIGQTQFQVLLNVLEFGMGIQEAIEAPRIILDAEPNFYRPGSAITVRAESRIPQEVLRSFAGMGHTVRLTSGFALGSNSGILRDLTTGALLAGADPRRTDYAVGY